MFHPWLIFLVVLAVAPRSAHALTLGIDVLREQNYAAVAGKKIGLVTNQTGVDGAGRPDRVVLQNAPGVQLVSLFAPEHGIDGTIGAGKKLGDTRDPRTGLRVFSLYGATRKPTPEMLRGLDALVFDLQDIGCRSYTYLSTMARCMEACGENNVEFIVLDRPNPLGGERVEGPGIETQWISFLGQFPVPYVHGMTAGELAKMINARAWMAAQPRLTVVPMRGWSRGMLWPDTGLRWVRTSPNIPRALSPLYYVATGVVGNLGGGLDIGTNAEAPFERVAAGFLNAEAFTARMRALDLPGVRWTPYQRGSVGGASLSISPGAGANLSAINVHVAAELARVGGVGRLFGRTKADPDQLLSKCYGSRGFQTGIEGGVPPERIIAGWAAGVERFRRERAAHLLY